MERGTTTLSHRRLERRALLRGAAQAVGLAGLPSLLAACGGTAGATSGAATATGAVTSTAATSAGTSSAPRSQQQSSAAPAPASAGQAAPSRAAGHVVFLDPDAGALGDIKTKAVAEFNANGSGLTVERVFGEGAKTYEKLQAMLAGGTSPDLFWSWGYWKNATAAKSLLRPFDPYVAREPADSYVHTWSAGAKDSGTFDGKLYGFTTQLGVPAVYVNQDLFKSAGVELPPKDYGSQSWTVDGYLDTARKLTRAAPDGTPLQFGSNMWGLWWAGFNWIIETYGGAVFDPQWKDCWLDHPEAIDAVTWLADLRLKEHVAPTTAQDKGGTFGFDGGKDAMSVTWAHSAADHVKTIGNRFQWNVYPLPRGKALQVSGCAFNWYCLPQDGKQPDAAWQFVRSMASPTIVQRFLAQGVSFPFMSSGQEAMWQDFPQLNRQMAIEAMPLVRTAPLLPRDPEIEDAIKQQLNPVFEGQGAVREAMLSAKHAVLPLL